MQHSKENMNVWSDEILFASLILKEKSLVQFSKSLPRVDKNISLQNFEYLDFRQPVKFTLIWLFYSRNGPKGPILFKDADLVQQSYHQKV